MMSSDDIFHARWPMAVIPKNDNERERVMDPTETLDTLRALIAETQESGTPDNATGMMLTAIGELFTNLDLWLASGGFLPSAWERASDGTRMRVNDHAHNGYRVINGQVQNEATGRVVS